MKMALVVWLWTILVTLDRRNNGKVAKMGKMITKCGLVKKPKASMTSKDTAEEREILGRLIMFKQRYKNIVKRRFMRLSLLIVLVKKLNMG